MASSILNPGFVGQDHPLSSALYSRPVWRPRGPRFDLDLSVHVEPSLGLFPYAEITRGCPQGCAFCQVGSLFGRRVRGRSPAVVAEGVSRAVRAGFVRFRFLASDAFAYGPRRGRAAALDELLGACRMAGSRELFLGCRERGMILDPGCEPDSGRTAGA